MLSSRVREQAVSERPQRLAASKTKQSAQMKTGGQAGAARRQNNRA